MRGNESRMSLRSSGLRRESLQMNTLEGKIALVTGSTDGVGRVVALRLGQLGARVLVHGRDRARGEQVVADITAGGGSAELLTADLASLAAVRGLAEAVLAQM